HREALLELRNAGVVLAAQCIELRAQCGDVAVLRGGRIRYTEKQHPDDAVSQVDAHGVVLLFELTEICRRICGGVWTNQAASGGGKVRPRGWPERGWARERTAHGRPAESSRWPAAESLAGNASSACRARSSAAPRRHAS